MVEREPYPPFQMTGRRLLELSNTVIAAGRCLDPRSLHAIPAANLPYVLAVNEYVTLCGVGPGRKRFSGDE